jgi:hypothetical protein
VKHLSDRSSETDEAAPELPEELGLTDVTDVICVGGGPGALAYAIACAEIGLEVMIVNASADLQDEETLDYLQSMAEDLVVSDGLNLQLNSVCAQPFSPPADGRVKLDPFVGHQLRAWSTQCASSVFGFMCTAVPDAVLTGFRTDTGEQIEAALLGGFETSTDQPAAELTNWLTSKIAEYDVDLADDCTLERLIFHEGRVVGAALRTPSRTQLTRAIEGVVFSQSVPAQVDWPVQAELQGGSGQVAVVSRRAGRFGRVELIKSRLG